MKIAKTLLTAAVLLSATGVAQAALTSALGSQVVNDTERNITWLANANLAASNTFGVSGIDANGRMNWSTAQSWIVAMNTANYLGFNDWRLPTVIDNGATGCDYTYSGTDCGYNVNTATGEMAHLFYDELGNKAYRNTAGIGPQVGWGLVNTGPFSNLGPFPSLQPGIYWSGTEHAPDSETNAWHFDFTHGSQDAYNKTLSYYAWAVRDSNVAPTSTAPVPAAAWLLGSGLLGLIGVARRKAA